MLTSSGERHLSLRRAVQPAFSPRTVTRFADAVTTSVNEALAGWRANEPIDVLDEAMRLARRAMLRTLFGVDAPEAVSLDRDVETRQEWIHYLFRSLLPYPELAPRPITLRHLGARRRIDRALRHALRAPAADGAANGDLLAFLSSRRLAEGRRLTEDELLDEARVFLVTGHETVGAGLGLDVVPPRPTPRRRGARSRRGRRRAGGSAARCHRRREAAVPRRVLAESFRLYPPTWIVVRVAVEPDVLPSGVPIPVGSKLYLCPWVVHRDSRWFPQPEAFQPDRFAGEAFAQLPEYAYFPFGGGARLCIGKRFALMECTIAVARAAQHYELELMSDQAAVVPDPGIILAPRGGVRLVPRSR